jgi:hypothetical protein
MMASPEVEQSFRNLVIFYHRELIYIDKGRKSSEFFSDTQRKKLVREGVLERKYGFGGCRLRLTKEAKNILNALMNRVRARRKLKLLEFFKLEIRP